MKGSPRRSHRLQKALHNLRITLLCGLLTFLVLRSSLGAGRFGTPVQDFDEIRHHLRAFRQQHQQRLLLLQQQKQLSTIASGEARLRKHASRTPLSLAALHEAMKPSTAAPRVMLVITGSSLEKCESAVEAEFLLKLLKHKADYSRLHGMEFFLCDADMEGATEEAKVRLLRRLMASHLDVEWIWWMASTVILTDMSYQVPRQAFSGHSLITHSVEMGESHGVGGSSMLVRNSAQMRKYFAEAEAEHWMHPLSEDNHNLRRHSHVLPSIDFGSCNLCSNSNKDVDLSCFTHMERAFIFADGQHSLAAVL